MSEARQLVTVRGYARHRGVSHTAVQSAIKKERLRSALVRAGKQVKIDVAIADQEWHANTDLSKAPTYVKARSRKGAAAPADTVTPPSVTPVTDESELTDQTPPPLTEGMSLADAARSEKYWSARKKQLEVQTRAGELVPAKAVADRIVGLFTLCRTKLLGIPAKAKTALPQLSHQDIAALDRLIRETLEDLASGAVREVAA